MNFIQTGYKGKNDWWMYLITTFIAIVGTQIGTIPLIFVAVLEAEGDMVKFQASASNAFLDMGINSNLYLFLMLLSFITGLVFLLFCIRYIHQKKIKWTITSRAKIDWGRVGYGALIWGGINILLIFAGILLMPDNFVWNFKPLPFFILVAVSVLFIPLQTSFEEVYFRGYLMQGLGMLAKNKWFPLLVTSLTFGLLHAANPEIEKLGQVTLLFYIASGLIFGLVTLLDEGVELAIGMHAINNIVAAFLVTTNWTVFQTDALFIDISEPKIGWDMILAVVVIYPLVLWWFARKYHWTDWKDKLFGTVVKPEHIEK